MLHLLITSEISKEVEHATYLKAITSYFNLAYHLVKNIHITDDKDLFYTCLLSNDYNEQEANFILTYAKLLKDISDTIQGSRKALSEIELEILCGGIYSLKELPPSSYKNFINPYGFNELHLAIIADKNYLAMDIIASGLDINDIAACSISPLKIIRLKEKIGNGNEGFEWLIETVNNWENLDTAYNLQEFFQHVENTELGIIGQESDANDKV